MDVVTYLAWLAFILIFPSLLVATSSPCCRRHDTTLDCTECKLTTLPLDLMDNTVTDLLLNGNNITHIPDGSFGNFTSLRSLALTDNPLKGLNKETFRGLESLKHLELGSTSRNNPPQLTSNALSEVSNVTSLMLYYRYPVELPSKILKNLTELETLCIALASDAFLGEEFKEFHKLKTLRVVRVRINYYEMTEKTFAAVPHIHTLHVEKSLRSVHPAALKHFTRLSTLRLILNRFPTPQAFIAIKNMRGPTLKNLILDGAWTHTLYALSPKSFDSPNFANVSYLSLKGTRLIAVDVNFFFKLPKLKRISLGFNTVVADNHMNHSELVKIINFVNIEAVDARYLSHQITPKVFQGMYHTSSLANFPHLPKYLNLTQPIRINRTLDSKGNLKGSGVWRYIPSSLRYIYASHATPYTVSIHEEEVYSVPENNIQYIDVSHTIWTNVPLVKGLNQLQGIDISSCGIKSIHHKQLLYWPTLIYLNMSNNNLKPADLPGMLSGGFKLKVLDLSKNNLRTLPPPMLSNLTALEHVSFRGNPLLTVNLDLSKNTQLQMLDLSDCTLTNLTDEFLRNLDDRQSNMNHTLRVDLSDNRFDCSCDTLFMIKWFQHTAVNLLNRDSISCKYKDIQTQIMALNYNKISEECVRTRAFMPMNILAPIGVFFGLLLVFILVWQFRWQLRWHMYKIRRAIRLFFTKPNEEILLTEMYHAFMAYNHSEDYNWVANELLPKVEDEWGLSLCVGQKHFEAGKAISENIVDAIDNSRRTVLVITPAFVSSEWCDFEMHMALVKGRSSIIIVYKEEVPVEDMSKTLRALMKSINYIEYESDPAQQGMFWNKLHRSLLRRPDT